MKDCDAIEAFVEYLRNRGHHGLRIDSWPDKRNDASPEIDAIAGAFAIEHTSIDTIPNQRQDADWFMRVAGGLETEVPISPASRLGITLEYHAVSTGQDWLAIRGALKVWITHAVSHLADGSHSIEDIPGVPFRLRVMKASDRPPGLFFTRYGAVDDTLPARIRLHLDRKANKLAKYQSAGKTTILLVESADIALMNEQKMLEGIRRAYPDGLPIGVDQLWYADRAIPDNIDFIDFTAMLGGSAAQEHG